MTRGVAVALAALAAGAADASAAGRGADLTEPLAALEHALECRGDLRGGGAPVILVHGTGSSPEESFSFGYAHVLPKLGFPVCTVRLPGRAMVDMQRSFQYVVYAIREVARRSGRRVSLIGHSQGASLAAYAPYFWPDLPAKIDDVIGLAGPYQGTAAVEASCADGACPVFAWQFRTASKLTAAYRGRSQPAGPSFTAIATRFDQLVIPAPQAARLNGASNVVIQDLCAAHPVEHYLLVGDAVAFAVALDALTHAGPAEPSRVDRRTCLQTIIPGADLAKLVITGPGALAAAIGRVALAPDVDREPALRCPFDASACPPAELRLTRRCKGGHLRVGLTGDVEAVRQVDFKLGRRLVRRVGSAPFVATFRASVLKRATRSRLRAIAYLAQTTPSRRILARALPRCGG